MIWKPQGFVYYAKPLTHAKCCVSTNSSILLEAIRYTWRDFIPILVLVSALPKGIIKTSHVCVSRVAQLKENPWTQGNIFFFPPLATINNTLVFKHNLQYIDVEWERKGQFHSIWLQIETQIQEQKDYHATPCSSLILNLWKLSNLENHRVSLRAGSPWDGGRLISEHEVIWYSSLG